MQAIILAAGMGVRLRPNTNEIAKCMVKVNEETLIKRQIEYLNKAGMKKIVIVCGYKKEKLVEYINKEFNDIDIAFVDNNEYMTTNNIYSLYLAKQYLEQDDTILLDSDLIFEYKILEEIINDKRKNLIAVSKFSGTMNGTVIDIDENEIVKNLYDSKKISIEQMDRVYKTINIYKMDKNFIKSSYIPCLEKYISLNKKNEYYETVFKDIIKELKVEINAIIFDKEKWYEIDDNQDLEIANSIFSSETKIVSSYENRYGGYWRFNNLKDFCYLINPKFPTQNMIDRIKYFSENLINQYPSTMNIQNLNAGRLFNINDEKVLTGNGATELIQALGRVLEGKVSIQMPVYNEYLECFKKCTELKNYTSDSDYNYNKESIIKEIYKSDIVVIVNPDNPSGNFINYSDIDEILHIAKENNTIIIFDESFIDFADKDKRYTLIKNEILNKYKNLIVIKSLSKSYGIPGIRLGMIATSDKEIIAKVKKELSIWNINSFAEYFLQTIEMYKKEYEESCDYVEEQRKKFYKELLSLKFMKVYNSQANYFMCKVIKGTSKQLTEFLLENYNVLIKDLSKKEGFNKQQYIRIAIKAEDENMEIIKALKEYQEQKL